MSWWWCVLLLAALFAANARAVCVLPRSADVVFLIESSSSVVPKSGAGFFTNITAFVMDYSKEKILRAGTENRVGFVNFAGKSQFEPSIFKEVYESMHPTTSLNELGANLLPTRARGGSSNLASALNYVREQVRFKEHNTPLVVVFMDGVPTDESGMESKSAVERANKAFARLRGELGAQLVFVRLAPGAEFGKELLPDADAVFETAFDTMHVDLFESLLCNLGNDNNRVRYFNAKSALGELGGEEANSSNYFFLASILFAVIAIGLILQRRRRGAQAVKRNL